jgi:REP element-mobilizing transposase RayT
MKIEYNNLYAHFILITQARMPLITGPYRERFEKYTAGIVNNNDSKIYSIYADPEHLHLLVSRSPRISKETLAAIIAERSLKFIQDNTLSIERFAWQQSAYTFSVSKTDDKVCRYILTGTS